MTLKQILGALGLVAAVYTPDMLSGQVVKMGSRPVLADSAPSRILASVPGGFPDDVVLEVLRQRHQSYDAGKRRALADLVVNRAIADPRVGTPAISAISMSGSSETELGGVPDPDAMQLLIRVHQGAHNPDERRFALKQLVNQINPSRALPYLRQVATSSNADEAYWSVMEIGRLAYGVNTSKADPSERMQAERLLRELYDQNLVKGRGANVLCETAGTQKWPIAARCRGIM